MKDAEHNLIRYIFSGKILPEREAVDFTLDGTSPIKIQTGIPEAGPEFSSEYSVWIMQSQVQVILEVGAPQNDVLSLKNSVEEIVRMEVDLLGYLNCCAYDVEITSVVEPNGKMHVFSTDFPGIRTDSEIANVVGIAGLFVLVHNHVYLRRSLSDLREAIKSPRDTGFYAYRAIESIKQAFVPYHLAGENHKQIREKEDMAWEIMRTNLCVDKTWIRYLKDFSGPQRHGKPLLMTLEQRIEAINRARKVIERYIYFLQLGCRPLSFDEFDVLS